MLKVFFRRVGLAYAGVLLCGAIWPDAAAAQTGQTAQIPLQFDFLNPGARSLGLGSAFIAVADDATGAFTNPAGLTQILRPEASIEGRYRSLDTSFLSGGRLSGTVTNTGIDTINGAQYGVSGDTAFRPYFLSIVVPVGRASIAAHRHELVLQENSFLSNGPFQEARIGSAVVNNVRNLGLAGDRSIKVDNYGVAAGFKVSNNVSLGADLAIYKFKVTSSFGALGFKSGPFSEADPATRGQGSTTTQSGSDTQIGFNAGVLVTVNPKVRVGAVYRTGTDFDFSQTSVVPSVSNTTQTGQFRTPMVGGIGVRVQPSDSWSFAVDYNRVQYSRLTTDYITFQVDPTVASRVGIPDGNEFHLGSEYTFLKAPRTPTIRAGVWYDPKHAVEYSSDNSSSAEDVRLRGVFPGGESLWHYCAGFGVPFSTLFEFNLGADIAKERRYVSASVVVRFHK
jgi:long-chain fatty acid transport protein